MPGDSLVLSLFILWTSAPAPQPDTYALITSRCEEQWSVVVSGNRIIRADPRLAHIVGRDWSAIKGQCRDFDFAVYEFTVPSKKKPKFKLGLK